LIPYAEGLKNRTENLNKSDSAAVVEVDMEISYGWVNRSIWCNEFEGRIFVEV
jgi:hypothetical protein